MCPNLTSGSTVQNELGTVTTSCTCDNTKSPAAVAKDNQKKHIGRTIGRVQDRPIKAAHIYSRYTEINILRPVLSLCWEPTTLVQFVCYIELFAIGRFFKKAVWNIILCNIIIRAILVLGGSRSTSLGAISVQGTLQFSCAEGALPVSLFLWDNNPYPHSHGAVVT